MDIKQMLKRFQKRLVWEAAIKAVVCGAIVGSAVGTLIMGASWLSSAHPELISWLPAFNGTWAAVGGGVGMAALGGLIFYLTVFRPTLRDAARRVDALGLEERAITMLDMEGRDRTLRELQCADAVEKLDRVPNTRLKLSVFKIPVLIACFCFLCMSLTIMVPHAQGLYDPLPTEQAIIAELIADLREDIENAEHVREEIKEELREIVDRLENELETMTSVSDQIAEIENVADRIHEILQREQIHGQLGEALKEFENTAELGDAIQKGDRDALEDALDEIRDRINEAGMRSDSEMSEALKDLAESLDKAVDKAGKEGDPLTDALKDLSEQLKDAAVENDQDRKEEAVEKTDEAIENAKDELGDALNEKTDTEKLEGDMQESIDHALEQLQPEGAPSDGSGGDGLSGSNGNGEEPPEEDTPPESGNSGQGNGPEDPSGGGVHSPEYDLYGNSFKDGNTPYTDEYDEYFRKEMLRLEKEDLTDAEREMIAKYFASMMVEKESEPID